MIFENIDKYRRHLRDRKKAIIRKIGNISVANYARCKELDVLLTKMEKVF